MIEDIDRKDGQQKPGASVKKAADNVAEVVNAEINPAQADEGDENSQGEKNPKESSNREANETENKIKQKAIEINRPKGVAGREGKTALDPKKRGDTTTRPQAAENKVSQKNVDDSAGGQDSPGYDRRPSTSFQKQVKTQKKDKSNDQ